MFLPSTSSTILIPVAVSSELQSCTEIYVPNDKRFSLLNELENSCSTDTSIDFEAIKEEKLKQKVIALQQHRRSTLPPEPINFKDNARPLVRRPVFSTFCRSFRPDTAMNVATIGGDLCTQKQCILDNIQKIFMDLYYHHKMLSYMLKQFSVLEY